MRKHRFKSVLEFEGKVFSKYKYKIYTQDKALKIIKSALPKNLADHALYCVISEKKLLLYTDSAAWSSQLRFYHTSILRTLLNSKQGTFEHLQIKVIPKTGEQPTKKPAKVPSIENISFIYAQANDNKSDDALNLAVLKLATTLKKLSDQ